MLPGWSLSSSSYQHCNIHDLVPHPRRAARLVLTLKQLPQPPATSTTCCHIHDVLPHPRPGATVTGGCQGLPYFQVATMTTTCCYSYDVLGPRRCNVGSLGLRFSTYLLTYSLTYPLTVWAYLPNPIHFLDLCSSSLFREVHLRIPITATTPTTNPPPPARQYCCSLLVWSLPLLCTIIKRDVLC